MRAGMHRVAVLTSGMWIYFRSQVRRCLKTNKQGEFNLLLREVCRADLKRRRRDNDTLAFAAGKFRLILGSGVSFRDVGGFTFEDATFKDFNALGGRFRGWARLCALIFDDAAHLIIKFK